MLVNLTKMRMKCSASAENEKKLKYIRSKQIIKISFQTADFLVTTQKPLQLLNNIAII